MTDETRDPAASLGSLTNRERADRARDFPSNTCGASRHAHMVAEDMADGVHGDDLLALIQANLDLRESR